MTATGPFGILDTMRHKLTNIDVDTRTGDCSVCGIGVSLKPRTEDSFRCRNKHNQTQQAYSWKRNARRGGYSADPMDYDTKVALYRSREGKCDICKINITIGASRVDHDHVTGKVRGLLCNKCNIGLGYFNDDPTLVETAAIYLG